MKEAIYAENMVRSCRDCATLLERKELHGEHGIEQAILILLRAAEEIEHLRFLLVEKQKMQ